MAITLYTKAIDMDLIIQTPSEVKNIEYFLVGDSFLQGCCVNRPYDIASSLGQFQKKMF